MIQSVLGITNLTVKHPIKPSQSVQFSGIKTRNWTPKASSYLPHSQYLAGFGSIKFGQQASPKRMVDKIKEIFGEIHDISSVGALASWDMETQMPQGSMDARVNHLSTLAKLSHKQLTQKRVGKLLEALQKDENFKQLSVIDQAIVRELKTQYDKATKLPSIFVKEYSEATTKAHGAWVEARKTNDFKKFEPWLEKIVELNRKEAEFLGYSDHPYDALLNEYEPGLTTKQVDKVFNALKQEIIPLLNAIQASGKKPDLGFVGKKYGLKSQLAFSKVLLKKMGFDFTHGRVDLSVHPFTTSFGSPHDVRVTTRSQKNDPREAIGSTIHEGGHGLYEQDIDPALSRTILAEGTSMSLHESQSRLWENQVGRSKAFWEHFLPRLKRYFPKQLENRSAEQFYRAMNDVKPSFIRTESDEVTYNLHILLRYEIEKELMEGKIKVKDLPEVWNQKMKDYLGVVPEKDSEGVLQDVHWSAGLFGYFPTYTLGNLYAAQIYKTANEQIPNLEEQIKKGNLKPLKQWLSEQVHKVGKTESAEQIVKRVTGEGLNPKYFMDYLWNKYSDLYALDRKAH